MISFTRFRWLLCCTTFVAGCAAQNAGLDVLDHGDSAGHDAMAADVAADSAREAANDSGVDAPAMLDAPVGDAAGTTAICHACSSDAECGLQARCASVGGGPNVCLLVCNPDVPTCPGSLHCVQDFTISATPVCTPIGGATEQCNGADDNCNGMIDEGLGSTTCGSGPCAMTVQNCVGGVHQTCTAHTSSPETCNGIDDDCNGVVDDGLGMTSCGVGACAASVPSCMGGVVQACHAGTPSPEVCGNSIDEDCDGVIDNGCVTCAPATLVWHIPAGTTGGPSCITTGGGTCTGHDTCSGSSCYDDRACTLPHCGTLRCNDGSYTMDNYCSVVGTCAGGTAVATGFSW